jgi:hypothetical protein
MANMDPAGLDLVVAGRIGDRAVLVGVDGAGERSWVSVASAARNMTDTPGNPSESMAASWAAAVAWSSGLLVAHGTFCGSLVWGSSVSLAAPGCNGFVVSFSSPTSSVPAPVPLDAQVLLGGSVQAKAVAVVAGGSIAVVCGYFSQTITVGDLPPVASRGDIDGYVLALSLPSLEPRWLVGFGSALPDAAIYLAPGPGGSTVLLSGTFSLSVTLGGGAAKVTSRGLEDALFALVNATTGAFVWAVSAGGALRDLGLSVQYDAAKDLVVAGGAYSREARAGPVVLPAGGLSSGFIVLYAAASGQVVSAFSLLSTDTAFIAFSGICPHSRNLLSVAGFDGELLVEAARNGSVASLSPRAAFFSIPVSRGLVPSQPVNLTFESVSNSGVRLRWSAPELADPGLETTYAVFVLDFVGRDGPGAPREIGSTSDTGFDIQGLGSREWYRVSVRAVTNATTPGPFASPVDFQTCARGQLFMPQLQACAPCPHGSFVANFSCALCPGSPRAEASDPAGGVCRCAPTYEGPACLRCRPGAFLMPPFTCLRCGAFGWTMLAVGALLAVAVAVSVASVDLPGRFRLRSRVSLLQVQRVSALFAASHLMMDATFLEFISSTFGFALGDGFINTASCLLGQVPGNTYGSLALRFVVAPVLLIAWPAVKALRRPRESSSFHLTNSSLLLRELPVVDAPTTATPLLPAAVTPAPPSLSTFTPAGRLVVSLYRLYDYLFVFLSVSAAAFLNCRSVDGMDGPHMRVLAFPHVRCHGTEWVVLVIFGFLALFLLGVVVPLALYRVLSPDSPRHQPPGTASRATFGPLRDYCLEGIRADRWFLVPLRYPLGAVFALLLQAGAGWSVPAYRVLNDLAVLVLIASNVVDAAIHKDAVTRALLVTSSLELLFYLGILSNVPTTDSLSSKFLASTFFITFAVIGVLNALFLVLVYVRQFLARTFGSIGVVKRIFRPRDVFDLPDNIRGSLEPLVTSFDDSRQSAAAGASILSLDLQVSKLPYLPPDQQEMVFLVQREFSGLAERGASITRIKVVRNPSLEQAFRERVAILREPGRRALTRAWPVGDGHEADREVTMGVLKKWLGRLGPKSLVPPFIDLAWHGASGGEQAILSICSLGFVQLSTLNSGWYGRGIYCTHHPVYAEYYATKNEADVRLTSAGERCLMLCWVVHGSTFPVTERMDRQDDPLHEWHAGWPSSDSHYVLVGPGGGAGVGPGFCYDEIVLQQNASLLPLAIVYYTK